MRDHPGVLETASGEWEQDGFWLRLTGENGTATVRVTSVPMAKQLIAAVDGLAEWVAEHDREKDAYDRASDEERDIVLGREEA